MQERISQVGGLNRYDEPVYKLAWAQTETMIQGGEWEAEGDTHIGYRRVYLSDGLPHWVLLKWVDAGKSLEMPFLPAQGPASYYAENRCPKTGLQILGGYPHHGSYKIALPLVAKWFEKGELRIHAYPLDTEIVEMMSPVIQASMILPLEAKMRFMKEEDEKDEIEREKQFDAVYNDIKLSNAARASDWVQDKARQIERTFNAALVMKLHRNRRFQSDRPI
ncbi:MAG: hypothetical protein ACLGXA_24430 [Acidobacteriota bacterium]